MVNYEKVHSTTKPDAIKITNDSVFTASNIHEYSETIDDIVYNGYEYDYTCYSKDEYLVTVVAKDQQVINDLQQELAAAKILLGVE